MKKLSVWCPRPKRQSKYFIIELAKSDIPIFSAAVIDIEFLKIEDTNKLSESDALLFISQNAVWGLKNSISCLSHLRDKKVLAIGRATANELTKVNLKPDYICKPPFSSETLVDDNDFWKLNFKKLLIITAKGGRDIIYNTVKSKNIEVSNLVCYKRKKIQRSKQIMIEFLNCNNINAVLVTSIDVAKQVFINLKQLDNYKYFQKNMVVFAFSKRIAKTCLEFGFVNIIVSKTASRDDFIKSIIEYKSELDKTTV